MALTNSVALKKSWIEMAKQLKHMYKVQWFLFHKL